MRGIWLNLLLLVVVAGCFQSEPESTPSGADETGRELRTKQQDRQPAKRPVVAEEPEGQQPEPKPKAPVERRADWDDSTMRALPAAYWLNTSSNVRHHRSCRYFENTKSGRNCGPDEGRACKICGG